MTSHMAQRRRLFQNQFPMDSPTLGPAPQSVHTWLSSPSKRSIIKKRMDQNVGSGIIVTAFG